jgi:lipopolysaccharide transport system ATP-binding protein
MNDLAVRVESVSKVFRLGEREPYQTLRDILTNAFVEPFRHARLALQRSQGHYSKSDNTIWALENVSFEVKRGEVVGVIGRNGAGKSTLLKILSRITEPTHGYVDIYGRVGSLLEVGTGFHGELSGRENIYLNGAILGMRKAEIERKLDEIVAFAEVEKFLDTPVKRYSSGMYLRLAFAVAAHLEPEILIVDEVLAVGDASFQSKCLNKMKDVARRGRTVLFVSHNLAAVASLCERAIWLHDGKIAQDGPSFQVVSDYLGSGLLMKAEQSWLDPASAPGNEIVRATAMRLRTVDGRITDVIDIREAVTFEIEFDVLQPGTVLVPCIGLENEEGNCVFVSHDRDPTWRCRPRPVGHFSSSVTIPGNFLSDGRFVIGAGVLTEAPAQVHFDVNPAVAFHVVDSFNGDASRGESSGKIPGVIRPLLSWTNKMTLRDNGNHSSDRAAPGRVTLQLNGR